MPQKTWVVGEEVLAADFNLYVQNQTVPQFPNTATRDSQWTSPPVGAMCVTTDTGTYWQRATAAWQRMAPSVLFRQWDITPAAESGDIGGTPTVVVDSGSVNLTVGRLYKLDAACSLIFRTAGTQAAQVYLTNAATNLAIVFVPVGLGANVAQVVYASAYFAPAATGATSFQVKLAAAAGSVAVRFMRTGGYPLGLVVTDVGPV
jgi:hypothetical protein